MTALVAYAGFAGAMLLPGLALKAAAFVVSALAFYRGVSFLHEVTHLRDADVPGFKTGYNVLIGVPFLVPSLMYEGVHNLHHAKQLKALRFKTPLEALKSISVEKPELFSRQPSHDMLGLNT